MKIFVHREENRIQIGLFTISGWYMKIAELW